MYHTRRHIKPNGLRCESPALRGANFCYFHSKLHSLGAEPNGKFAFMRFPSPEGSAAIQLSITKITDALISGSIDPKRAGQLGLTDSENLPPGSNTDANFNIDRIGA